MHTKGYSASETKASLDQARSLIEQADGLGEPLEDPLLLFSVLFAVWVQQLLWPSRPIYSRDTQTTCLLSPRNRATTAPLVIAHRALGPTLAYSGELAAARAHFDQGVALYDPAEHRQLATRFVQDPIEQSCPLGHGP